jgi:malonyl CoA-acyl carrier protein transacylase
MFENMLQMFSSECCKSRLSVAHVVMYVKSGGARVVPARGLAARATFGRHRPHMGASRGVWCESEREVQAYVDGACGRERGHGVRVQAHAREGASTRD